ncbi:Fatty acid synthase subunit beta (FAS I), partial [Diplonema papillatum]
VNWAREFMPRLLKSKSDGQVHIDTKLSRLLGRPPIIVPGMTPTTIGSQLITATLNAGFQIEISGGGHFRPDLLDSKIELIQQHCRDGEGVTLNMLFLNPALWGWQYPHVQKLRRAGIPIEGVTIAAGVPSPDKAHEFITAFKEAGVKYVSFKPGTEATIRQVVAIAETHPDVPIIMQWTGGRAGGHHSFEDQHSPLLRTYGMCRRQKNLVLVAGGGLGDAKSTLRWLTGEWSEKFGRPPMPFDGVLMGSRLMVAKEAETSPAVKDLIVAAPGITEEEEATWETTYTKPHGGILTVTSELGEPIHKIANRGVRLWKEFDDTIFSLPREKQLATVLEKKDYIIQRLNADAQKVYFPAKLDGTPVSELTELTYEEVARRLVGLLYDIAGAWVDLSLRDLTGKWLRRVEERFTRKTTGTKLSTFGVLDTPGPFLDTFFAEFSMARRQTLSKEDEDHFIELCAFPLQKPVPFIPRLDERFNTWFKKDSLWQSEALQFVVGHDADRVNILHGPLAASYSTKANEPVADILGNIYKGQIDGLTARGVETTVVEYFGGPTPVATVESGFSVSQTPAEVTYKITAEETDDLPSSDDWLEAISGGTLSWLKALVGCKTIVTGTKSSSRWIDNPLRRTLRPRLGQKVVVSMKEQCPTELTVYNKADDTNAAVCITRDAADATMILVRLYTFSQHQSAPLPLELRYRYCPECGAMPIKEGTDGAIQRTKDFYSKLWLGDATAKTATAENRVPWELTNLGKGEQSIKITKDKVVEFCRTVGNANSAYSAGQQSGKLRAPMDYAMVVGWKSVIRSLFAKHIDGDLLSLVHLGNSFRVLKEGFMLQENAELSTTGEVTAVKNDEAGNKIVEVRGVISDAVTPVIEIVSRFLYRGAGKSWDYTFSRETHLPVEVMLKDAAGAAVARSKPWIEWTQPDLLLEGAHLTFHTQSLRKYKSGGGYAELHVTGHIMAKLSTMEEVQIGTISFEGKNCAADPVESYLQRHGIPLKDVHMFEEPRYFEISEEVFDVTTKAPASNMPYSLISGDTNPIHTNPYFSDLAGLPATIVHGMWSSAAVRRLIETFAADNLPHRVTLYSVDFVGMVLPDDVLNTTLSHVGMTQGKKLINITVTNQQGSIVIKGTAEVEEAPTAYVFTGQGSQSPGMGMDLYGSSKVAKDLWDRADLHLKHMYGFSILDIVRRNPKEIVIYFGGKHGAVMRNNYRKLVYEVAQPDGSMKALPLFPEVSPTSSYHTFVSPKGLLNATQFTQPALTLMEVAAYKDMEEKGLVQKNAAFAGHSLGEYSSLSAIAEVLPIEALVDVVFYRGMTMQVAVPRDDKGRSDYGMVAVNPTRVTEGFGHEALEIIVDTIRDHAKQTLQIVNYNVIGQQYVASGELTTLDCLANVLNYIKLEKINVNQLLKTMSKENVLKQLQKIVASVYEKCLQKKKLNGGRAVSERGFATIPLPGIDVPFHSSFLLSGVAPFRELLKQKLSVEWIDVKALRRRYIPNLVARPFDITKEFVECVHKSSSSPLIEDVLKTWKDELNAGEQQQLGFLLLVELLAYQFASPVRWIETQDVIFGEFGIERLVEIGPEPTLTTMASRTLKAKYEKHDDASSFRRTIVHAIKQQDELYYKGDGGSAPAAKSAPAAPAAPAAAAPAPAPVAATPVAAASGPAAAVADAKITASEILRVMVSTRVRKPMTEVPLTKTIKELVGGKSTLQNEILGDLGQEFPGFTADKPEEEPLKTLAGSLTGSGSLGKVTSSMVNKMIGSKMPGGFGMSKVREHMSTVHGLGPLRTDGALLHGLTMEPTSRLGSEADAKKWLDSVAQSYAAEHNVSLGAAAPAAGAPMMMAAPAAGAGPAAAVPDAPVAAIEFIRVLVAVKMKMPATSDLDKRSIKELVAGKSTLQNELLGDLQQEFGDAVTKIDGAADMPLADVAKALQPTYTAPGKYTSRAVQKLVSAKMPGSFGMTAVKAHLASKGLGPQRQDGALLHALSMEPAARLGGDGDAKAFWDGVTSAYASAAGVSLGGGGGGAMMASAGPAVSSAAMTAFQERYNTLLKEQMSLFATYLDEDPRAGWSAAEDKQKQIAEQQEQLDAIKAELGDVFIDGLAPMFTRKKARVYEAAWNWVKQDYVKFLLDMTSGMISPPTLSVAHQRMVWHIMNRADKTFFNFIEFYTKVAMGRGGNYFQRLRAAGYMLAREIPSFAPVWMLDIDTAVKFCPLAVYTPVEQPAAPSTTISSDGVISYNEVPRPGVASYVDYAKEMAHGMDVGKLQQNAK